MRQLINILILILIYLLSCNYVANATIYKFIVETIPSISELKVKNTEKKEIQIIESWKNEGGIFFVACDNPQSTIIQPNKTIKARLYAMESNKSTKWFEIEMNTEISIQHSFAKYTDNIRKYSTEAFILSNFLNQPLSVGEEQLRQDTGRNFRFTNPVYAFLSNQAIKIAWQSDDKVQKMEIIDLDNYTKIFNFENFNDTVFQWDIISETSKAKWKEFGNYQLEICVADKKFVQHFKVSPIIANYPLKNRVLHQSELNISWSSAYNSFHIQIKDIDNKLLFEKINYKDTTLTVEKMQAIKKLPPGKVYHLIISPITNKTNHRIKIPFFFLLNDKEYVQYLKFTSKDNASN